LQNLLSLIHPITPQMYSDYSCGVDWEAVYAEIVDIRDRLNLVIDQMDGNAEGGGVCGVASGGHRDATWHTLELGSFK